VDIRLSEVLAALSHALDITEGQPRGHSERTCLIAMRLAEQLEFDEEIRCQIFYAALLKDAGCSSNAAKVAALYGADDQDVKRDRKMTDQHRPAQSLRHLVRSTSPGLRSKVAHLGKLVAFGAEGSRSLTALRCERGADVARSVGLDEYVAGAIRHLDEHWDGRGYPEGLAGEAISMHGRILCLAQTVEVFWQSDGAAGACAMARERRGTWFDPTLVDALSVIERDRAFWETLDETDVARLEPEDRVAVADEAALDRIAGAFARIVDAKTPYTANHSAGVADIAVALARTLGLGPYEQRTLHRAGLLHDIGKLGVSNRILDKPAKLDEAEWQIMRRHPEWSLQILQRVPAFERLAFLAACHHERLDGTGYFRGLNATELDLPARILAVADVAEALSADRPYREALTPDVVLDIMRREAGTALDARVFEALEQVLPTWSHGAVPLPSAALAA
jgi:putative nucleotidyltransferase with HDIG domain